MVLAPVRHVCKVRICCFSCSLLIFPSEISNYCLPEKERHIEDIVGRMMYIERLQDPIGKAYDSFNSIRETLVALTTILGKVQSKIVILRLGL